MDVRLGSCGNCMEGDQTAQGIVESERSEVSLVPHVHERSGACAKWNRASERVS